MPASRPVSAPPPGDALPVPSSRCPGPDQPSFIPSPRSYLSPRFPPSQISPSISSPLPIIFFFFIPPSLLFHNVPASLSPFTLNSCYHSDLKTPFLPVSFSPWKRGGRSCKSRVSLPSRTCALTGNPGGGEIRSSRGAVFFGMPLAWRALHGVLGTRWRGGGGGVGGGSV